MIFLPLMVFGLGRLVLQLSETTEMALLVAWGILSFVLPGFAGNAMLRYDLRKRMTRAITESKTLVDACAILSAQASSRQRLIGLGGVNLALLGMALGFYLAVPEDGLLTRVRSDSAPVRAAESGPVIDLTALPALAVASAAAPTASSAPEPLPVAPFALASTPLPVVPASAPPADLPVLPASTPPVAVIPPPLPMPAAQPLPAGPVVAKPKALKPYFINVGLFAKEANARKAQVALQEAGLSPTTQEIGTGQGKRTRLRAGPFDTLAQAEAAAETIRALKLEAQVFQP
jgi:cell division septation protein DedD